MNKKIYFISDAHLGSKSHANSIETERKLCRWLDFVKQDARAIYLMGDIFDYWYEYKHVVPKGFTRVLGKLAEITDAGVAVHFFAGNHDLWLTNYLTEECGIQLHFEPEIHDLFGKRFFLHHGDGLGDNSASFQFLRKIFHSKFLRKCFSAIHPRWTIPLAHNWSNKSRETGGTRNYLGEDKEHLVIFAKQKSRELSDIDYFVFGHRHILLNLLLGDNHTRVIILGDWIQFFSYGVFDGNVFELHHFEEA